MTTPVSTPKLLKEYLDELDEKTLKEFQWDLIQIKIDGSRPIPRCKLENATIVETVDKLVEAFGEDDAVAWTVDTLLRMNHFDLASRLIRAKVDQSMEQREEEPETSSAREEPREVDPTVPTAIGDQSMEQREDEPETSSAREKPREVDPTISEDLSCSICLSVFTEPVVLQCGHSFCQTCVHKYWEKNIVRECSLCKQFIPEGDLPINFSLKSLCEKYRGRNQGEPSGGHRNHTESFQTLPENIREKQEALKETKKLFDSSIERIKTQSFNTENKITDVFKMLHAFLNEEEKTRQAALRKEARLKIHVIHLMHDRIKSKYLFSHTLGEIGMIRADKSTIETRAIQMIRKETDRLNRWTSSQGQINVSKHVENLPLKVLEEMSNNIKQTSVVVDPNTASSPLSVSDHPTNVNDTRQLCPGNPEKQHKPSAESTEKSQKEESRTRLRRWERVLS